LNGFEVEAIRVREGLNMWREIGKKLTPGVTWVFGPVDSKPGDVRVPARGRLGNQHQLVVMKCIKIAADACA
jgi:hypothetical protein